VPVLATGCSSSDGGGEAAPATTTTLVPSSSGDRCTDPVGDLDIPPGVDPAVIPTLAGVDLVTGVAEVEGDVLAVEFTVAGAIADVPDPTFVVAQGDPLQPLSFELRLTRRDGQWQALLITWPDGKEQRQAIATPIVVGEQTVGVDVPLASLPPIALSMQFGAASEVARNVIVIDDCSSLNPG
jgi:hypothetical protein